VSRFFTEKCSKTKSRAAASQLAWPPAFHLRITCGRGTASALDGDDCGETGPDWVPEHSPLPDATKKDSLAESDGFEPWSR
jgi:hypothetical protein